MTETSIIVALLASIIFWGAIISFLVISIKKLNKRLNSIEKNISEMKNKS